MSTTTAPALAAGFPMSQGFDDETRDALAETFNMALGEASQQFAELVHDEIELSVPYVELIGREGLVEALCHDMAVQGEALCRIEQHFDCEHHQIATTAALLFPERASLEIVRQMLGEREEASGLTELEQDALAEIGNIIINSCMNSLAQVFDREMVGSLPAVQVGQAVALFPAADADDAATLLARVGMRMASSSVSGHVIFMMDLPSLSTSIRLIRRFFGLEELVA
jgi:chemotaxis protein CheC